MSDAETESCADTFYINIGTAKCCLFVRMSSFLLRQLERYPLLYWSVEEALECAKIGYFGIGIMAFAQLLNIVNEETPDSRHLVAHRFLELRPTKATFDKVVDEFKCAAAKRSDQESSKCSSIHEYQRMLALEWEKLIAKLHDLQAASPEVE